MRYVPTEVPKFVVHPSTWQRLVREQPDLLTSFVPSSVYVGEMTCFGTTYNLYQRFTRPGFDAVVRTEFL